MFVQDQGTLRWVERGVEISVLDSRQRVQQAGDEPCAAHQSGTQATLQENLSKPSI